MIFLLFLFIFILPFLFIFFFRKKRNSNITCSCSGKTCDEEDGCGNSCLSSVCNIGEKCFEKNCCTPICENNSCGDDGCGGICNCPNGYICKNRECVEPPDCKSGICGDFPGGSCKCNDRYCSETCCKEGICRYDDICNSRVRNILGPTWAKFCNSCNNTEKCGAPSCSLLNPIFEGDTIFPSSGEISCTACGETCESQNVEINKKASYYEYDEETKKIEPRFIDNYCKDDNGKCNQSCLCITDDDCTRLGCKNCIGGYCS